MWGRVLEVNIYFKFHENRSRGLGAVEGRKSPSPIDKAHGLYNSLHYRTSRDNDDSEIGWLHWKSLVHARCFRKSNSRTFKDNVHFQGYLRPGKSGKNSRTFKDRQEPCIMCLKCFPDLSGTKYKFQIFNWQSLDNSQNFVAKFWTGKRQLINNR